MLSAQFLKVANGCRGQGCYCIFNAIYISCTDLVFTYSLHAECSISKSDGLTTNLCHVSYEGRNCTCFYQKYIGNDILQPARMKGSGLSLVNKISVLVNFLMLQTSTPLSGQICSWLLQIPILSGQLHLCHSKFDECQIKSWFVTSNQSCVSSTSSCTNQISQHFQVKFDHGSFSQINFIFVTLSLMSVKSKSWFVTSNWSQLLHVQSDQLQIRCHIKICAEPYQAHWHCMHTSTTVSRKQSKASAMY